MLRWPRHRCWYSRGQARVVHGSRGSAFCRSVLSRIRAPVCTRRTSVCMYLRIGIDPAQTLLIQIDAGAVLHPPDIVALTFHCPCLCAGSTLVVADTRFSSRHKQQRVEKQCALPWQKPHPHPRQPVISLPILDTLPNHSKCFHHSRQRNQLGMLLIT